MKELLSLNKLIEAFKSFPSVGSKTAERMGYNILNMPQDKVDAIVNAIIEAKSKIHYCPNCGALTEDELCSICLDNERDHSTCIVVQDAKDIYAFEKLNSYRGSYHVLGGVISSLHGVGPDDLKINELKQRIVKEGIKELILATSPTIEGETTALYISRILKNDSLKISRLAYGMPAGSQLEYVDELTIEKAIEGRTDL